MDLTDEPMDDVVAENFSRGSLANIAYLKDVIEWRPVDQTTGTGVTRATEGADYVFHLAASVGGIHHIRHEHVDGLTPSVLRNQQVLEAARRAITPMWTTW